LRVRAHLEVAAVSEYINAHKQSVVNAAGPSRDRQSSGFLKPKAGMTLMSTR